MATVTQKLLDKKFFDLFFLSCVIILNKILIKIELVPYGIGTQNQLSQL
jgi:hypothetical protein